MEMDRRQTLLLEEKGDLVTHTRKDSSSSTSPFPSFFPHDSNDGSKAATYTHALPSLADDEKTKRIWDS